MLYDLQETIEQTDRTSLNLLKFEKQVTCTQCRRKGKKKKKRKRWRLELWLEQKKLALGTVEINKL